MFRTKANKAQTDPIITHSKLLCLILKEASIMGSMFHYVAAKTDLVKE